MSVGDYHRVDDDLVRRVRAALGNTADADPVALRGGDVRLLLIAVEDHATCEEEHEAEVTKLETELNEDHAKEIEDLESQVADLEKENEELTERLEVFS